MQRVDFPLHFDGTGRTAQVEAPGHVRDLIEQVLFTAPGERVNRPSFGSGVHRLVFAPNDDALAGATQVAVQGALQLWLGEQALVEAVDVTADGEALEITVQYVLRAGGERRVERFASAAP